MTAPLPAPNPGTPPTPVTATDTVRAALGDRYDPRKLIAVGGMGEVWRATDQVLQRDVACKVLKAELATDEGFRSRFLNEARTAAALQHPGVAAIFDFGERPGQRPYLVMELVEGSPLTAALREGALAPETAREVVAQVAEALSEAHALGLVHRDVKPGNILVTPEGRVKLTDFGIARAADGVDLTRTGEIIGTPTYLSPEQAQGETATPASDVYALGVVLFECLTGARPFAADGPVATALAHIREDVPDLPPDVPADLAAVTRRALAKDPADRYPDGGALAAALRQEPVGMVSPAVAALAAEEPPPGAVPTPPHGQETRAVTGKRLPPPDTGAATVAWAGGSAQPQLPATPATEQARRRRLPIPVLVMIGLAVVLVVALVVSALAGGGSDAPRDTPSSSPTPSTRSTPSRVKLDPSKYVGKPVADVRKALAALGLTTTVDRRSNPGGHDQGDVAALDPSGSVARDATITLSVWGAPPAATQAPAPKPKTDTKSKSHGKGKPGEPGNGKPGKGKKH